MKLIAIVMEMIVNVVSAMTVGLTVEATALAVLAREDLLFTSSDPTTIAVWRTAATTSAALSQTSRRIFTDARIARKRYGNVKLMILKKERN